MSREAIFVNTGVWFAYINARDSDHQRVREFFDSYPGHLVTSSYVFDETVTLTLARLGHQTAVTVGRTLLDTASVELVHITPADEKAAWRLLRSGQINCIALRTARALSSCADSR